MKELIREANSIPCTQWYEITALMEQADEETREHLKWIMCRKRLEEEYGS